MARRIADINEEAEKIIDELARQAKADPALAPVRIPAVQYPGYYVFANKSRAIIAAPFFLPLPSQGFRPQEVKRLPAVQMLGFETTDSGIVQSVHRLCDLYRNLEARSGAQAGLGTITDLQAAVAECMAQCQAFAGGPPKVRYRLEVVANGG